MESKSYSETLKNRTNFNFDMNYNLLLKFGRHLV